MSYSTIKIDDHQFRVPRMRGDDLASINSIVRQVAREGGLGVANDAQGHELDLILGALAGLTDQKVFAIMDRLFKKSFVRVEGGAFASLGFEKVAEATFGPDLILQYRLLWASIQLEKGKN